MEFKLGNFSKKKGVGNSPFKRGYASLKGSQYTDIADVFFFLSQDTSHSLSFGLLKNGEIQKHWVSSPKAST